MDQDQIVTPWVVESVGGINYLKLIENFGATPIDGNLIKEIERVTKMRAHKWLRRGLFFSHRDLENLLSSYEKGEEIFIYTGRGPSSESMHLGHMIPFIFTKYLQEAFGAIVIIQMSDDEKFFFRKDDEISFENYNRLAYTNAVDIISVGFQLDKTYIFANSEELNNNQSLTKNARLMLDNSKINDIKSIFGLTDNCSIGKMSWPIYQSIPAFSNSFDRIFPEKVDSNGNPKQLHCLVAMAIDQDPYFRLTRDFAHKMRKFGYLKPSCIHSEFLISLQGRDSKMSSTGSCPTIFLSDTTNEIEEKIRKYAFSGGGETKKIHQEKGANLNLDVSYQWLLYFEDDDDKIAHVAKEYSSGRMSTSEIKRIVTECVINFINKHQDTKLNITEEIVKLFFDRNRELNHELPSRDDIKLLPDKDYDKMGIKFDRYFLDF
jgi:tryptophanyl-tRNA synthetase